eukprot:TRINITY_DN747_c0_g1_i2.p1 TRINITY_DN747_c0_g1~~TRINITY_DN747_c0_g1_i2.p1  ORF type:complete len:1101 (-),score=427.88 TRINITY_DN747_c0_g1_i2:21-2846(-)
MKILRLLSEEIFDFSEGRMTSAKTQELKSSLNEEFDQVYELITEVLNDYQDNTDLIFHTLETLLGFLNWIPVGYIFETGMVDTLVNKCFPVETLRIVTLRCLIEIAALKVDNDMYNQVLLDMFVSLMGNLEIVFNDISADLDPEADVIQVMWEDGSSEDNDFISNLGLFFSAFFKEHGEMVEQEEPQVTFAAHEILLDVASVNDVEVFKSCLEYWKHLTKQLYMVGPWRNQKKRNGPGGLKLNAATQGFRVNNSQDDGSDRIAFYAPLMSKLRVLLISRMPRPEEVLIVEDDVGNIIKERLKDTAAVSMYKNMKSTLVFLTHLDGKDTESIMEEKLSLQSKKGYFSWNDLNTLCWAIGAISGSQTVDQEKRFLVTVIRELLNLVEKKTGKENKAVIASNIMYIVGQYPRFLKAHWKFLTTVVTKLFEFMRETHPGVQDMACETFLKIASRCAIQFAIPQEKDSDAPYIETILEDLPRHIQLLETHQIRIFFEAVGHMIAAVPKEEARAEYLSVMFELPNQQWNQIMTDASENVQYLQDIEVCIQVVNILGANESAATSAGPSYESQLGRIYLDIFDVYKAVSGFISEQFESNDVHWDQINAWRQVKCKSLQLVQQFVENADDLEMVANDFLPPLFESVLGDYNDSIDEAREAEVLSLMATIIKKMDGMINEDLPAIFAAVFDCTLNMLRDGYTDFPEIRTAFYKLLGAFNDHGFDVFFSISEEHFQLFINAIVHGFRHLERNVSETALTILDKFLQNIRATPQLSDDFFSAYFVQLLEELLVILTDTLHTSSLRIQANILALMFDMVIGDEIGLPIWDENDETINQEAVEMSNGLFLQGHMTHLISESFPNLTDSQVDAFVDNLGDTCQDPGQFKEVLRDFLVELQEFAEDAEKYYADEDEEEKNAKQLENDMYELSVPGLVAPFDPRRQGNEIEEEELDE